MSGAPIGDFVARVVADGYELVEVYFPHRAESVGELAGVFKAAGLGWIAQMGTGGATPADHVRSLEEHYVRAVEGRPRAVNCQTGSDFFSVEENLAIFRRGEELVARHGVPLWHETHRGRALFTLPAGVAYLSAVPSMRVTLDVSHWFCVHESDLRGRADMLATVIERVDHVHARVGHAEGPQVSDPRNPGYADWVARSVEVWEAVMASAGRRGRTEMTVTPEFGPPTYAPLGVGDQPVAEVWGTNRWMMDYLRKRWG